MTTPEPKRRKTPRLSRNERRNQLIEKAAELFAESSYGGVTTAMLARNAGVTEPVLYQHFESKLQLYHVVLEEGANRTLSAWAEIADTAESPLTALFDLMRAQTDEDGELWTYYKIHTRAVSQAGEPGVSEILADNMRRYIEFVTNLLTTAQSKGEISKDVNIADVAWLMNQQGLLLNFARQIGMTDVDDSGTLQRQMRTALKLEKVAV